MRTFYRMSLGLFGLIGMISASGQTVTHTIPQIQGELFASPLVGQIVTTTGIISANEMTSATSGPIGYFVQDGAGPWSGVFVYDNTQAPNVGDEVIITAEVTEYFDCTELINVTGFEVVSSGNSTESTVVETGTLGAEGEPYEGVLVTITNAECVNPDADYGEAIFNDGSGEVKTNDYMHIPEDGWILNEIYTLTGPLHYTYEEYKIEVRSEADVQVGQSVGAQNFLPLQTYPNPVQDMLNVVFPEPVDQIQVVSTSGQIVSEAFNVSGKWTCDMTEFPSGLYFVSAKSSTRNYQERVIRQ
jgi:hypothetical protein